MSLDFLVRHIRIIGFMGIVISVGAWWLDLDGWVYTCPYCRVQRTAIGLLGLLMILPNPQHWVSRYVASVFAVFGLAVAAMHFFNNLKELISGDYVWDDELYFDPLLLAFCALWIMTGQILLLYQNPGRSGKPVSG
ncbi:MAG: hypothetical protein Q8J72_10385 [Rhodocyclaceae bacterium]|nr:hypothetical protein [Rhodocyclaceae bacterium]MDP3036908.1 hypothetical protein [Rhodocyclaceae bacterium]